MRICPPDSVRIECDKWNPKGIPPSSPGLRVRELPWVMSRLSLNLEEVAPAKRITAWTSGRYALPDGGRNLFEVGRDDAAFSQGSSFLATLGWRAQSLWDWRVPP